MKIVISPAKSLNFATELPTNRFTQPEFLTQALEIVEELRLKSPTDLASLMHLSPALANLNWERNQAFTIPFTPANARPAIYTFNGDVYQGLDVFSLPDDKIDLLQDRLCILSGQYGVLKPLDLMQAYRLEMGTSIAIGGKKNLYSYWKTILTNHLNKELQGSDVLINLASTEYFKVVDVKKLCVPVITPEFKEYTKGSLKTISFYAKKARGLMVRYIIDNEVNSIDELKSFAIEGYGFDAQLSNGSQLVFTR